MSGEGFRGVAQGGPTSSPAPRDAAFYAALPAARAALRGAFFDKFTADPEREPAMLCAGHAHIDVAYLWTLQNTRKKCGRTFATALRLMDEFPEYHFTQSQPQACTSTRGRTIPRSMRASSGASPRGGGSLTGGMWVEADCNVTSGESLIRQVLFGQRFYRREFGKTTRVLWLPDVFGYAALPQIIKGCGMDYFMTTKISWSQFNRQPYDTFRWRGIDGTEVLTHFVTTTDPGQTRYTYNGKLTAAELRGAWDEYRQKDVNGEPAEPVRTRRRRRRPHAPDDRVRAPVRRPGPVSALHVRARRGVLRAPACPRVGQPALPRWVGEPVPGVPPRHLHVSGAHQESQPQERSTVS